MFPLLLSGKGAAMSNAILSKGAPTLLVHQAPTSGSGTSTGGTDVAP